MNKIRIFLMSVCFVTITTCIGQPNEFNTFINNFNQLKFPVTFDDGPIKNNTELFKKGFTRSEFLKYLNDIKEYTNKDTYFYYGGKTKYKEFNILIYKIINFGDAPALDTIKIDTKPLSKCILNPMI